MSREMTSSGIDHWPLDSYTQMHSMNIHTQNKSVFTFTKGDLGKRILSSWLSSPLKYSLVPTFTHPTPVDTWRCLVLIYQLELWFLLTSFSSSSFIPYPTNEDNLKSNFSCLSLRAQQAGFGFPRIYAVKQQVQLTQGSLHSIFSTEEGCGEDVFPDLLGSAGESWVSSLFLSRCSYLTSYRGPRSRKVARLGPAPEHPTEDTLIVS